MDVSRYMCLLTASGLGYHRRTGRNPLTIISGAIPDISTTQTSVKNGAVLLGEVPDEGLRDYETWMVYHMQQDGTPLTAWEDPFAGFGVACPGRKLVWGFDYHTSPRLKITAEHFLEFINRQVDPGAFRRTVVATVSDYSIHNFEKPVSDHGLEDFLYSSEGPVFLDYSGDTLWYDIAENYAGNHGNIRVDKDFERFIDVWDDPDKNGGKSYGFAESETRSTTYAFKRVPKSPARTPLKPQALVNRFRDGLDAMAELARKLRSPFCEAFTTSRSVLDLSEKGFSLSVLSETCDTTARGRGIIQRQAGILKVFEALGSDPVTVGRLFACEISDVFGGMGSWNDQSVPPEHYDMYFEVSRMFSLCLDDFRAALVSEVH